MVIPIQCEEVYPSLPTEDEMDRDYAAWLVQHPVEHWETVRDRVLEIPAWSDAQWKAIRAV